MGKQGMKQQFVHFIYSVVLYSTPKQSNPPHFSGLGTSTEQYETKGLNKAYWASSLFSTTMESAEYNYKIGSGTYIAYCKMKKKITPYFISIWESWNTFANRRKVGTKNQATAVECWRASICAPALKYWRACNLGLGNETHNVLWPYIIKTGSRSNICSLHFTSLTSSFLQLLNIQRLEFIEGIKKQHLQPSSRRKLLEKTNSASQ